MNDEKIASLIEKLATKLGTTAEYLWGVLIKQAAISATVDILFASIIITGIVFYTKWLFKRTNDPDYDIDDHDGAIALGIVGGVLSLIGIIILLFCIQNIFTGYFNPEYWALKTVFDAID
jgi:nitrate reductase gamma subunit